MHFSLVKRGWRGMFSFGSMQEYIPFFFLSISSIRQSPMILLPVSYTHLKSYITHRQIMDGATVEFEMGPEPGNIWYR